MVAVRNTCPVDYRLCNQTVTIYHRKGDGYYTRRLIERGAFLDFKKTQDIANTGSTEVNSFLLVIPCGENPLAVGDKVFLGVGPEISTRESWADFIPSKVSGLVVVKYVDPKYWNGKLVHVEAGG